MAWVAAELAQPVQPKATAQRVVDLGVQVTGAGEAVILSTHPHAGIVVVASTDETLAEALMTARRASGDGSTADAWGQWPSPLVVDDLWTDTRWPRFAEAVREIPALRSSLTIALHLADRYLGLLCLFDARPGYFTEGVQAAAVPFAQHAAIALASVTGHDRAEHLRAALDSSRLIGTAQGVLMATRRLKQEEAFALLRRRSNDLNRKLLDLASDVVLTGELPPGRNGER
jgi:GAF domain-containing protein